MFGEEMKITSYLAGYHINGKIGWVILINFCHVIGNCHKTGNFLSQSSKSVLVWIWSERLDSNKSLWKKCLTKVVTAKTCSQVPQGSAVYIWAHLQGHCPSKQDNQKQETSRKGVERVQYRDKGTARCHIRTLSGVCRTRAPLGVILGHCQVSVEQGHSYVSYWDTVRFL